MKRCSYDKLKYKLIRMGIYILEVLTFGIKIKWLRGKFVDYYFKHEEI